MALKNIYLLLLNIASLSCTNFAHNYLTLKFKIVWDKIYSIYKLDLDGYTYILTMDKTGSESNYCKMQTIAKLQFSVGFECVSVGFECVGVGFSRILWNSTFAKNFSIYLKSQARSNSSISLRFHLLSNSSILLKSQLPSNKHKLVQYYLPSNYSRLLKFPLLSVLLSIGSFIVKFMGELGEYKTRKEKHTNIKIKCEKL